MRLRFFMSLMLLLTSQLIFAQSDIVFPNVYTFENGAEVYYADGWDLQEIRNGITVLQREQTDLIFATAPFIVTDAFVSLEQILVNGITIAETPIPDSSNYTLIDFGDRVALAYVYGRDAIMGGIVAVIRFSNGTIGSLDVVTPKADFEDQRAEISDMLYQFDQPIINEDTVITLTLEQEVALNANWRGTQDLNQQDYRQAVENFDIAIENNPESPIFYENRGYAHRSLGDYEQAIEDYTQAIQLDAEVEYPYFYRAYVYVLLKEYELAIVDQTEAIRLNPTNALYYTDRGATKRRLGDFEGAIEDYDEAIKLAPNDAGNYFVRAMAYAFIEDFDGAVADYEKVFELDPEYSSVIHLMQHYVEDDLENAIQGYSNHIFREPNFAPLYFHRGNAYREIGDVENALSDLKLYLELAGEDADPRANEWIAELEE